MNKTPVTDEQILEIRRQQKEGVKKKHVREQFPGITKNSFDNIWNGTTKAYLA